MTVLSFLHCFFFMNESGKLAKNRWTETEAVIFRGLTSLKVQRSRTFTFIPRPGKYPWIQWLWTGPWSPILAAFKLNGSQLSFTNVCRRRASNRVLKSESTNKTLLSGEHQQRASHTGLQLPRHHQQLREHPDLLHLRQEVPHSLHADLFRPPAGLSIHHGQHASEQLRDGHHYQQVGTKRQPQCCWNMKGPPSLWDHSEHSIYFYLLESSLLNVKPLSCYLPRVSQGTGLLLLTRACT